MFRHLILLFFFALFLSVPAQINTTEALTVSPVKLELRGDPGSTVGGTFQLINEQNETLTFYVSYSNFEAEGETGTPRFTEGTEGLATWLRLIPNEMNSVTLEPGQTLDIPYEIVIPENATPGGHFGAIFWGSSPTDGDSSESLAVGAKVGILVFLTVNGDVEEGGGLLEFGTTDNQTLFKHLPVHFYYRFRNDGGDRVIPEGTVVIKNMFGMTTEVITANASQSNVLPTTIRRFEEMWGSDLAVEAPSYLDMAKEQWQQFALGYYRAELTLSYGTDALTAQSSVSFWVFPWQLLSVLGGGLLILLVLFRWGIKRYNRWIIAQALSVQTTQTNQTKKKRPLKKKR